MSTDVRHGAVVDLSFFGSAVSVDTGSPAVAAEIRRLWQAFLDVPRTDPVRLDLSAAPVGMTRLEWINTTLNSTAMALTPCFAAHAGVVAVGTQVIAFPAVSGAGKSTLTGACLRRGFQYVSDEGLCIDYGSTEVWPYPRPLALSAWAAGLLGIDPGACSEIFVAASDLHAPIAVAPALRLHAIILLEKTAGAPAAMENIARSRGAETLLKMSFNHYRRPADALRLVTAVVSAAKVVRLTYSDPYDGADLLASLVEPAPSSV
jgi:hypothetical protein